MPEKASSGRPSSRAGAYQLAVALEEKSYQFYDGLAAVIPDTGIRNEILFLRDEEQKHKDYFENLLQGAAREEKGPPRGAALGAPDLPLIEREVLQPMQEALKEGAFPGRTEALRLGVRFEQATIRFFRQLRESEADESVRQALDRILEEEDRHLRKLNIILAY
jgi:rubrerythrin